MTDPRVDGDWLSQAELDLLCVFGEVSAPFPLRTRSHGSTLEDRRDVFRAARAGLADRGLADHRGPLGVAREFVTLLRDGLGTLDLIVARRDAAHGVLMLSQRDRALVVSQDLRRPDAPVRLVPLSVHDAVDHLARLVPELGPAMAAPFSLPRRAIEQVHREILAATDHAGGPRTLSPDELDRVLQRHGIDDQTARRMATHLQPVLGNGQAGVAVRRGYAGEWTRDGEDLRWLDTQRGRFRIVGGDSDWMSVNPFAHDDLRVELRGLAQRLW